MNIENLDDMMKHEKGLYLLTTTVMWERISFYIFTGVLVLYMVDVLHFSNSFAAFFYGIAVGLTYFFQIIGGYFCDEYLGNRKSLILGTVLILIAQLIFTYDASLYHLTSNIPVHSSLLFTMSEIIFLAGVGIMAVGISFFKVSVVSFIGLLYQDRPEYLDSAFSIDFMFINIGGFFAPLALSFVVGVHNPALYQYGFLIGVITILVALIFFLALQNKYLLSPDGQALGAEPQSKSQNAAENESKLSKIEINRLEVIILVFLFIIIYYISHEQVFTSIMIFAADYVDNIIPLINVSVGPAFYLSLIHLFIIFLSPIYIKLFEYLSEKNKGVSNITKMGFGALILALSFLILSIACYGLGAAFSINMSWMILFSFILVNSELLVLPVSLSLISKLSPSKYATVVVGIYYATFSVGEMLSGYFASALPSNGPTELLNFISIADFSSFFMIFVVLCLVLGGIWLLFSKRIIKLMHGLL